MPYTSVPPTFDLPVLRLDPFLGEEQETRVTFAVHHGCVTVVRGGVDPMPEGRVLSTIDFTRDYVRFGHYIRVDSDALRFALEGYGL